MLHLIPPPLHRAGLRIADRLRRRWWRWRRPTLRGCRVIALDGEDRVLLIRHSYGSRRWLPPGGGIGRGENALAAASRELLEETGCRLTAAAEIDFAEMELCGAANRVHVIAGTIAETPRADHREVIEARLFAADALPEDMPRALHAQLPGWIRAAKAARRAAPPPPPAPPAPTA